MSCTPAPFALDHAAHLDHFAVESTGFRDVLAGFDPEVRVPCCPGGPTTCSPGRGTAEGRTPSP